MRHAWIGSGLILAVLGWASVGLAQSGHSAGVLSSCGPAGVNFRITKTSASPVVQNEPGTALVYFIADDQGTWLAPTTLMGVDGQWVGATHGSSWLYFRVPPGVHHVCAMTEYAGAVLAHFTAVAGGVYYFEAKDLTWTRASEDWKELSLVRLDSDEGQYLVARQEFSASQKR